MGAKRTITVFSLDAIDLAAFSGDDVDHSRQSHVTIQRRGRASQHLDMVNLLCADGVVELAVVSGTGIQSVAVLHDENLLLTRGIDAMHGIVTKRIAAHIAHARHIGCQYLSNTSVITQHVNHLAGDDGDRHRGLLDQLFLTRCRLNGGASAFAQAVDHINKTHRVFQRAEEILVLLQQQAGIML